MMTDDPSEMISVSGVRSPGQQPPGQVQSRHREAHPGADLAGEAVVVSEPLEVDTQGVWQPGHLAVLETIPEHLTLLTSVHVVTLEFVS